MSFRRSRAIVIAGALVFGAACSAAAQAAPSDRPFRGLFGAADTKQRGQTLAFDWSVLGAYDDNPAADTTTGLDPLVIVDGMYGSANGGLTYEALGEHMSLGVNAASSGRYYPDLRQLSAFDGGGGLTFVSDIGRRTKIDVAQAFFYQPYYSINFITGVRPSGDTIMDASQQSTQIGLNSHASYSLDGRFGLTRTLGARSTVRADYGYRSVQFGGSDETFSWRVANVTLTRGLSRNGGLRVGYGYGVAKNEQAVPTPSIVNHNLDLGVDYNRQLSFSRRTRIHFSTGSTAVIDRGQTSYRLLGSAELIHEVSRTWSANVSYNRGAQYLPGFGEMFFSDTVRLRIGGLLGRRVEAAVTGGFTSGELGFETPASSYSSTTAAADFRVAMSRTLSLFTQYTYYRYGFDTGVQMPFGLPPQLDRQALRIGISGWLPVVR